MKNFESKLLIGCIIALGAFALISPLFKDKPKSHLVNMASTKDTVTELERETVRLEFQNYKTRDSLTHVVAVMGDGDAALIRIAEMPWSGAEDKILMNGK